jgi:hypothetical protein
MENGDFHLPLQDAFLSILQEVRMSPAAGVAPLTALSSGTTGIPPACRHRPAAVEGDGSRSAVMWGVAVPLQA